MTTRTAVCGTYGGYQRHGKDGEPACGPCRKAATQYMRDFRAASAAIRKNDKMRNRARYRALARLALEYPERYAELMAEEARDWQLAAYEIS